jgi:hypothetical protein
MTKTPAAVAAVLLLATAPARADTLTPRERTCQVGRAHAVYDMIVAEGDCFRRCHAAGGECAAPAGAGVSACLARAQARALRRVFGRSCERDCPECYDGCGPDVAAGEVGYSTGLVSAFAPVVFCAAEDEPAVARCADTVAKASAWFARRYGRCFARCRQAGCDAAEVGDARARTCAERAARRAAVAVDSRCDAAAAKPACYGSNTGATWTDLVRTAVDAGRPVIFCASPSGAFIDTNDR